MSRRIVYKIKKICPVCSKVFYVLPCKNYVVCCSRICSGKKMMQENNQNWRGGKVFTRGYIRINLGKRFKLEHRLIMEKYIGRSLKKDEIVHHINRNKSDNRIENLQIVSRSEHIKIHHKDLIRNKGGRFVSITP